MSSSQQILSLCAVMALRNVDLTGYVTEIRIAYGVSQFICLVIWCLVFLRVKEIPEGGEKIKIPAVVQFGNEIKPSKEASVQEHDMDSWKEEMQKIGLGLVIVSGIHCYWETLVPLVLQSVMIPFGVFGHKLFKCHMLKMDVERPFKSTQPFASNAETPVEGETCAVEGDKKKSKTQKKKD